MIKNLPVLLLILGWLGQVSGYAQPVQYFDVYLINHESVKIPGSIEKGLVEQNIEKARVWLRQAEYDKVIYLLKPMLPLPQYNAMQPYHISKIQNTIGAAYLLKGRFDSATSYFYLAARAIEGKKSPDLYLLHIYNNLSVAFYGMLELEKSFYYIVKAEQVAAHNNFKAFSAVVAINKGRVYRERKEWAKAIACFQKAKELCAAITSATAQAETNFSKEEITQSVLQHLADLYYDKEDFKKSLFYLKQAARMGGNENPYYHAALMQSFGKTYYELKEYDLAKKHLYMALETALFLKAEHPLAEAHLALANLYAVTGHYQMAYKHRISYEQVEYALRQKEKLKAANLLEVKYRTLQKDKEIAEKKWLVSRQVAALNYQQYSLKKKNVWIFGISISLLFIVALLINRLINYKHQQKLQEQKLLVLEKEKRIELLKATIEGEETERSRLADGLHDGIGSIISAAKMNFSTLTIEPADKATYHKVMDLINEAAYELRATAHNLMPKMLLKDGLDGAVRSFCERVSNRQSLVIDYQSHGDFRPFERNFELFIYRIIQELINNIIKHASATHVLVQLSMREQLLTITIEDNGIGFQMDKIQGNGGKGLSNLKEKIDILHGHISVESTVESGTQVYIEFDLQYLKIE